MTEDVSYKFQNLQGYKLALDYLDQIYEVAGKLPKSEKFNLSSQLTRAATSIVLNICGRFDGPKQRGAKTFSRVSLEIIPRDNSMFGRCGEAEIFTHVWIQRHD
jgi:hypothetical protein